MQISPDKSSVLLVDPVNLISVPLIRKSVDPQSLEGPLNDLLRAIENLDAVQSPDSRNELAETLRSDAKARAIYVERSRSKNLISDSSANLLTSAYSGYGYEILYESDGYHVERAGSGLTRLFDDDGNLTDVSLEGDHVHLSYEGGKLVSIVDNRLKRVDVTYTENGLVQSLSEGGQSTTFSYSEGRLISTTTATGVDLYGYNRAGLLSRIDRGNKSKTITYTPAGDEWVVTAFEGKKTEYSYKYDSNNPGHVLIKWNGEDDYHTPQDQSLETYTTYDRNGQAVHIREIFHRGSYPRPSNPLTRKVCSKSSTTKMASFNINMMTVDD